MSLQPSQNLGTAKRKTVLKGAKAMEKQTDAMWSTFADKPSRVTPMKECLRAVTMFSNIFANAIGQVTASSVHPDGLS